MIKNILNLGDAALYCDFGNKVDQKTNIKVIKYFENIKKQNIYGINNLTPSYNKLIISFDLNILNFTELKKKIEDIKVSESEFKQNQKIVKIPTCCDDEFALDIERLSLKLNLTKKEILEKYFNKEYFCYMTGFIAGMPFLGDIDKKIRFQRLETPRVKVPRGAVGITEQFTNIYTFESPGGWNIIGNTPLKIFDKTKETDPNLINPGDTVVFKNITKDQFQNYNE